MGRAEYDAMVKGGCMGLGMQSLCKDIGVDLQVHINIDASAAKA